MRRPGLNFEFNVGLSRSTVAGMSLRAWLHRLVALTEQRQHAQLAAVFAELDRDGDGCISVRELGNQAPGLVAARSLAMAAGVPAHRLHAALAGVTMVRWCLGWTLMLVAVHLIACAAECARVHLGIGRPGRRPFTRSPGPVRRASTETALHYDTPLSRSNYEQLKVVLMSLSGLATLRLGMAFASFACVALALNLAARVGRSARLGPTLREPIVSAALGFARLVLWWLGFFAVDTRGHIARGHEARILVANHVQPVEVLLLFAAARCPSFVTRIENNSLPLFAGVAHVSRAIVVDRELRTSRERTLREIGERATEPGGPQLMVFPEGTCNNQHALFRFNRGAFCPGLPVQPVLFHYLYARFNPCLTGEAAGGHELPGLMWRTACQLVSRIEVKYLPVDAPSEQERADPLRLRRQRAGADGETPAHSGHRRDARRLQGARTAPPPQRAGGDARPGGASGAAAAREQDAGRLAGLARGAARARARVPKSGRNRISIRPAGERRVEGRVMPSSSLTDHCVYIDKCAPPRVSHK